MNIEQTQFSGAFDLTDTLTLDFGGAFTDLDNFEADPLFNATLGAKTRPLPTVLCLTFWCRHHYEAFMTS